MVHLITGPIDSGKTTMAMTLFRKHGGGGVCCPKVFQHRVTIGYDLLDLAGEQAVPFIRKAGFETGNWETADHIGPWRFNRAGFQKAGEVIQTLITARNGPVFLDEIGPLELSGRGFAPILDTMLASGLDCWLVVRSELLHDVMNRFQLEPYEILEVEAM